MLGCIQHCPVMARKLVISSIASINDASVHMLRKLEKLGKLPKPSNYSQTVYV
jgi:hypothetical protein